MCQILVTYIIAVTAEEILLRDNYLSPRCPSTRRGGGHIREWGISAAKASGVYLVIPDKYTDDDKRQYLHIIWVAGGRT